MVEDGAAPAAEGLGPQRLPGVVLEVAEVPERNQVQTGLDSPHRSLEHLRGLYCQDVIVVDGRFTGRKLPRPAECSNM